MGETQGNLSHGSMQESSHGLASRSRGGERGASHRWMDRFVAPTSRENCAYETRIVRLSSRVESQSRRPASLSWERWRGDLLTS